MKCLVDANGERLFTDAAERKRMALDRLYEVAARLSGISDEVCKELAGTPAPAPSGGFALAIGCTVGEGP